MLKIIEWVDGRVGEIWHHIMPQIEQIIAGDQKIPRSPTGDSSHFANLFKFGKISSSYLLSLSYDRCIGERGRSGNGDVARSGRERVRPHREGLRHAPQLPPHQVGVTCLPLREGQGGSRKIGGSNRGAGKQKGQVSRETFSETHVKPNESNCSTTSMKSVP